MPVTARTENGIGHLTLDEPPLNILTRGLLTELREGVARLRADGKVRVLLLTARGRHFSAGASVEEHLPGQVEAMLPEFMETVEAVRRVPMPVVVAVQGRCLGGGLELALAGDVVLAAESAVLGVPEIRLGVFPPAACVQLPPLVGRQAAAELVFTGATLDGPAAERAGLVRRAVPDDRLPDEALALAEAMARHSAASLRAAKKALGAGTSEAALGIYLDELMHTADAPEGLRAFLEKRDPSWSHA